MHITKFGPITVDSLITKGGNRLATFLKEDIFDSTSLPFAMSLYDKIYRQVDSLFYGLINGEADDRTAIHRMIMGIDEIENFFLVMSRKDVFEKIWQLDNLRGNTALFRDLDQMKAREIFPYLMRFFDLFHNGEFKSTRDQLNKIANESNPQHFLDKSLTQITATQDKQNYTRFRSHFSAKYRGLFRAAAYSARKTRSGKKRRRK